MRLQKEELLNVKLNRKVLYHQEIDIEQILANKNISVVAWLGKSLHLGAPSVQDKINLLKRAGVVDAQLHLLITACYFGPPQEVMDIHYAEAHVGKGGAPKLDLPNDSNACLRIIDRDKLAKLMAESCSFEKFSSPSSEGKRLRLVGAVVRSKTTVTKNRKRMMFMSIDCFGNDVDIVVWPEAYEALKLKPKAGDVLSVVGRREFNGHRSVAQLVVGDEGEIIEV